jgi:hypothetical protein
MKRILLSLVAIATISLSSFGQAPEGFKYQAVVRDAGNTILNNQAVGIQLTIQQGSIGGTAVYTETFIPTSNAYGLVNIEIGSGNTTDDFSTIDWSAGPYFIETAIDVTGGTSYTVMGTSQLMSVPYALYAKTSGNGVGPQGPAGNDGIDGVDGAIGATGPQGPIGNDGAVGATGATGAQGIPGNDGADGATGPQGPAGNDGAVGATGATGAQGIPGDDGAVGATGAAGPQGATGPAGADGTNGTNGTDGAAGPQGVPGNDGNDGATGAQGPAGNDGVGIAQTLSQTGSDVTLSDGGGTVSVNDADADSTNELQTLSVSAAGDTLYLQNGGFVIIPGISVANTPVQLATLTTSAVSSLTNISATSGGNITDDGGANITTRGVCYSINTNPTTADNITNDGNGTGSFTSNLSGLTTSTTYYVRAYATNSAGTAYGNELSFTTLASAPLAIGDSYQGGIVFYLIGSVGGLIAAPTDHFGAWGCNGTPIPGADGTFLGDGAQNTIDIEAGCATAGTAADICANLVLSGYTDWYLPSKDELNLMYQNIGQGNALGLGNVGGFDDSYYWSSSETDSTNAWRQDFFLGNQFNGNKTGSYTVRAVRAF